MRSKYRLQVTKKALSEMNEFVLHYSNIGKKVNDDFMFEINKCRDKIISHPEIYNKRYKEYRRINMKDFPVMILFLFVKEENLVKVVACKHEKSNPKKFYK